MLDPMGYVASWNRGAESIKGYTVDEIIGKHFSVFFREEAIAIGPKWSRIARRLLASVRYCSSAEHKWFLNV